MKRFLILSIVLFASLISINAQTDRYCVSDGVYMYDVIEKSIAEENKCINESSVFMAGKYLKASANYEVGALCLAAASAGFTLLAINENDKANDAHRCDVDRYKNTRDVFYAVAGICGLGSIICYAINVHYKWKSGKSLEIAGNRIVYNF